MKKAKRIAALAGLFALILGLPAFVWSVRRTPVGIGFRIPSVFAQAIFQQSCSSPFVPITGIGWQTSNLTNDQILQWGCLDKYANLQIAGTIYIGFPSSSSDIGQQLNSISAELPAAGWKLILPRSTSCMDFSTPVTFNVVNQIITLEGNGPANASTNPGSSCLNYVPTTATAAFTLDWTPVAGGGYAPGGGFRDITLTNNKCSTNGGCGSSATGIKTGPNNGGAHMAEFFNVKVSGFGKAYDFADNNVGWGVHWNDCSIVWNTTGINYTVAHELDSFSQGVIAVNGTGINLGAGFGNELSITNSSIDSNTVAGITMSNGSILHTSNVHWENFGIAGTMVPYVQSAGTASSILDISGGIAYDDIASGSSTIVWFESGQVEINGLFIHSNGRTYANPIFTNNTRGYYSYYLDTPGSFTNACSFGSAFCIDARNLAFQSAASATIAAISTLSNCSSSASPAVCGLSAAGSVTIAAGATTKVVNTTAVTANSQIFVMEDDSLGTKLGVTCNTSILASPPEVTARVAATSFTITTSAAPVTNPACYSYFIVN